MLGFGFYGAGRRGVHGKARHGTASDSHGGQSPGQLRREEKAASLTRGVELTVTQGAERVERGDAAGWAQVKLGRRGGVKRGSGELGRRRRWAARGGKLLLGRGSDEERGV